MPLKINFLAVLAAVIVSFLIQMVWYTALFAKPWMKEMSYDPTMRPDKKSMMKGMLLTFIGSFLFCLGACFLFSRLEVHTRGERNESFDDRF